MSYMTISSQEKQFFTLFMLSRTSDNTTSQNIGGTNAWAVPPPQILGGPSPPSPLGLRPWSQIILDAKSKSRGLIVTQLDLKNAFGEVHHDLIRESLNYHHRPSIGLCTDIFNSIYHGSSIIVAVKNEWTSQLMVERGVLQGDPCSSLMFNLCFNTLMKTLSKPEFKSLGYIWGPPSKLQLAPGYNSRMMR